MPLFCVLLKGTKTLCKTIISKSDVSNMTFFNPIVTFFSILDWTFNDCLLPLLKCHHLESGSYHLIQEAALHHERLWNVYHLNEGLTESRCVRQCWEGWRTGNDSSPPPRGVPRATVQFFKE
ncbi:hypothetical protein AVEN_194846-1 [Araneus ventricosus]|uniref:Uncharacterized protein n=1 Tax=Araneus ventricosus TaxID=182803 RepID=A0A4Y2B5M2_ARAVE|nr:hypothetical protein AVEN_194846-1 [Araneus ventricosus]